jgi:hypothetical protein
MKTIVVALMMGVIVPGAALGADPARSPMIAQAKTDQEAVPKLKEARLLTVRGTVEAIDKEKQTVTLKGPKQEPDRPRPRSQEARGDPGRRPRSRQVLRVLDDRAEEAGRGDAGVWPWGRVGRHPRQARRLRVPSRKQVTVTATIVSIDQKAQTATIKGPEGNTVTVKARDPKNLDKGEGGRQRRESPTRRRSAISLDKPAKK